MAKQRKDSLIGKVRTRIAPSPTGLPHVGTAFQAIFDWVYAHRYQGKFAMRIEDTDQKRFISEAEAVLHQAFTWLSISPDEGPDIGGEFGPYRQSERLIIYQRYAKQLVDQGHAYYCFCSSDRLESVREKQRQEGIPPKYNRYCRDLDRKEVEKRLAQGEKAVIRLKVPDNEIIIVNDKLRGKIEFDSGVVDDQVLLKSDGYPTYHLAVVVDDYLMQITHIVRGEEWLPSAPKHILLYRYFGWSIPELIHTPTLRNTDRSKLSKRKGNASVWWYREHGFLPTALVNFLVLLVWKPSENQEIFSLDEMVAKFEWEEMNIAGPIFDIKKLEWLNGKYIRGLKKEKLLIQLKEWMSWVIQNGEDEIVANKVKQLVLWQKNNPVLFEQAVSLSQERARTLLEIHELIEFFFQDAFEYDLDDLLQGQSSALIATALIDLNDQLSQLDSPDAVVWEKIVRAVADTHQLAHKVLFMSMRSALTARKFTPPLYDIMTALGWNESLQRLCAAVNHITSHQK